MKNVLEKLGKLLNKDSLEIKKNMSKYRGKTIAIKFGGHAMIEPKLSKIFAQDIAILKKIGINPIIVHGGGPQINTMLSKLNIRPQFINGLRVTNSEIIDIVEMILSGDINKKIASDISLTGVNAIGISGRDSNLIKARKLKIKNLKYKNKYSDIGFVGSPTRINIKLLKDLISKNYIPVVAPIGQSSNGDRYNINADTTVGAIASAMRVKRLLMLTDVSGVKDDNKNLISLLTIKDAKYLIKNGIINSGMIPKVETCISSVRKGINAAVILDGRVKHAVLLELFTDSGVGTLIKE